MTDDLSNALNVSYCQAAPLGGAGSLSLSSGWATPTGTNSVWPQSTSVVWGNTTNQVQCLEEKTIVARLIRYTVADPDKILADKKPERCVLMQGTIMLNGADDRGFLMDLAPKVAEKLEAHNAERIQVIYEDSKGDTRTLKAIKLSNLDVVIEVLKSY